MSFWFFRAEGYTLDKFTKDKIYKLAFEGGRMCYLVNMISESYVEVSKNYLLDRIAGISNLFVFLPLKFSTKIVSTELFFKFRKKIDNSTIQRIQLAII